ncbi:hypothetical protein ACROYT_G014839 [Oculina patagonica]
MPGNAMGRRQPERKLASFKQHIELMFTGPPKSRNQPEKCSFFLIWVDQIRKDIYNTWTGIYEEDRKKPQTYYDRFENRSNPRHLGYSREIPTALRILAQDCDFKYPDEKNRDRIVFGTNSPKVRVKLISKGAKLTLDKAIEIARSLESSRVQLKAMAPENTDGSIHLVQKRDKEKRAQDTQHQNHPVPYQPSSKSPKKTKPRRNCGRSHDTPATCPTQSAATSSFEDIVFESITIANPTYAGPTSSPDEIFVSIQVSLPQSSYRKTTLKTKLDTGAEGNILPMRLYLEMFPLQLDRDGKVKPNALSPSYVVLTAYGCLQINHHCIVTIPCPYRAVPLMQIGNSPEQLKKPSPVKDKQDLIAQYPECFNDIGEFQGEYHITLDPSVPPVVHPPRRVPISLRDNLKSELDDMVKN